jgi:hypothetical protein
MNEAKLKEVLELHAKYLLGDPEGVRANLKGAKLWSADLEGADLRGADLSGANLRDANLGVADLYGANLAGANLLGADLEGANLRGANLTGANLLGVILHETKLDVPIYTFSLGRHSAVATKDYLQIGCERHDWNTWTEDGFIEKLGRKESYSTEDINIYRTQIQITYSHLFTKYPEKKEEGGEGRQDTRKDTAASKIRITDRDNESPWQRFIRDTLEKAAGDAVSPLHEKGIITDEEATELFGDVYVLIMDFLEGRRG